MLNLANIETAEPCLDSTTKNVDGEVVAAEEQDWRKPIIDYLQDPSKHVDRALRNAAFKYALLDGELFRRTTDGMLHKCLNADQARVAMGEVHEGICGTHQSAYKMKWLLKRANFYWPTMMNDCFRYYKGCEACQKFGNIQLAPAALMNPIIKPWPFRGWGSDWTDSSSFFKGASICAGGYRLFYQVDGSSSFEEYDT